MYCKEQQKFAMAAHCCDLSVLPSHTAQHTLPSLPSLSWPDALTYILAEISCRSAVGKHSQTTFIAASKLAQN